jgi:hypothetical protein
MTNESVRALALMTHLRDPAALIARGFAKIIRPIKQPVGWVELFAKPITVVQDMMGIAALNPSYARTTLMVRSPRGGRLEP